MRGHACWESECVLLHILHKLIPYRINTNFVAQLFEFFFPFSFSLFSNEIVNWLLCERNLRRKSHATNCDRGSRPAANRDRGRSSAADPVLSLQVLKCSKSTTGDTYRLSIQSRCYFCQFRIEMIKFAISASGKTKKKTKLQLIRCR